MLCQYPVVLGKDKVVKCGRCKICRIQKRREWSHRLMLEASLYENNAFLTLTYSDDNLPEGGTLVPKHLTDFIKRLRWKIGANADNPLRYYGVGEYGSQSERPHYHLALFNFNECMIGQTDCTKKKCCDVCELVATTWKLGQIFIGQLTPESAGYVCGYVVKKMTNKDDEYVQEYLKGRHPEFARMSRNPGIAADVAHDIASEIIEHDLKEVPYALRHGQRLLPVGRYLRTKIQEASECNKTSSMAQNSQLQELSEKVFNSEKSLPKGVSKYDVLREEIIKRNEHRSNQMVRNAEKKLKGKQL